MCVAAGGLSLRACLLPGPLLWCVAFAFALVERCAEGYAKQKQREDSHSAAPLHPVHHTSALRLAWHRPRACPLVTAFQMRRCSVFRVCCNGVCTCCLWKHALLQLQPGTGRLCLSCNCSSATQPCLCFNTRRTRLLAHTALLQANHVHTLHTNAHTESICCSSRSATMTWGSWPTATAERHWQPLGCPASAQTNARDKGHYRYTCS